MGTRTPRIPKTRKKKKKSKMVDLKFYEIAEDYAVEVGRNAITISFFSMPMLVISDTNINTDDNYSIPVTDYMRNESRR